MIQSEGKEARIKPLNHATVELSGMNLIEASAGTGKTYAIASLYLRLLVEKELRPEQILVVTYTEAATKELHLKIRNRIREALEVIEGANTKDSFLLAFCEKETITGLKKTKDILERALADFDTASIYTIHGFCLRALQDNVFESGSLYDTELITDQTQLIQELLDDFWRIYFFNESAPLLGYALRHNASDVFKSLLTALQSGNRVKVIPEFNADAIDVLETTCRSAGKEVCLMWQNAKDTIQELMKSDKGLSRSASTYRLDLLEPLFTQMNVFADSDNPFELFDGFEKFTTSGITQNTKPKSSPPNHIFFDYCETLFEGVQQRFLALQSELVSFYRKNLPLRKQAGNVRFFDDLLEDLYNALVSENGGEALAALLRFKYNATLIDEFQDTDPVQYNIFKTIYAGSDLPLFLIGDPKQAIYSFRGADIFAYMKAAREVGNEKRFTLTENWRSTPQLLKAFNILFNQQRNPFIYDEISYHPLKAGSVQEDVPSGESDVDPLQIWFMDSQDEKSGMLTVDDASTFGSKAVAHEIDRLLQDAREAKKGNFLICNKEVTAGDIAVIVRTHRQAGIVLNALRAKGIAGVMRSDMSIFASREAEEVSVLLSALCDPGNEPKIRAALVTDILGRTGNDIANLIEDEEAWTQCLREFHSYHHLWVERGFIVMIRELMSKKGVRGRLLSSPDLSGERRLTNLLHCVELLHQEEHKRRLGTEGLAVWFNERLGAADEAEEYQIRLETDESAVKIVTVHVSKGLEYPVVFCPFLWGKADSKGNLAMFHNENCELIKDFGSSEFTAHQSLARKESLAESLRLLYVALTRAKNRCYLFTVKTNTETSPINYLIHASNDTRYADNQATALAAESKAITAGRMVNQLQELADGSEGSIGFRQIKRDAEETSAVHFRNISTAKIDSPYLHTFHGTIDTSWRVSSFTSFTRHEQKLTELPDRDEPEAGNIQPIALESEKSIFAFPRGAQAGIFMHWIFEKLDFANPSQETILDLVEKGLERYSYKKDWLPYITAMVQNVLSTSLSSGGNAFTLGSLHPGCWITELEFFFPLKFITSPLLEESLARHGVTFGNIDLSAQQESLQFKPVKGMLMGFIDMVFEEDGRFYLLDWKSNHLGNAPQDYGSEAMQRAMATNLYSLQYLLYTVALNRYLSLRVKNYSYGSHFGGVIYVFLRGVSPGHSEHTGFYRDLPSEELIEELTNILIEQKG
ncbi:MAG: exodeoxyribonuclease V subunit beta [Chlorobiales bacterium]|nr:exodeoxyribonuclease V subunit beta [Chlorobiales bacterium]